MEQLAQTLLLLSALNPIGTAYAEEAVMPEFNKDKMTLEERIESQVKETTLKLYKGTWAASIVEPTVSPVNPALKLEECNKLYVNIKNPNLSPRFLAKVGCSDDGVDWKIMLNVRVTQHHPVVVSKSLIKKGDPLTSENIAIEYRDVTNLQGRFYQNIENLEKAISRKNIKLNDILNEYDVVFLNDIESEEVVHIKSKSQGLSVITTGKAITSGDIGDQIRVENLKSGKVIQAVVLDEGTVKPL